MSLQSSQFKTKMEKPTLPSCYESWGLGPFPVQIIDHHTILLKDGTRIAMKLFIPVADVKQMKDFANVDAERIDTFFTGISAEAEEIRGVSKFPAILEYIPYRKSDKTACRDIRRHPVMASHGYVVARADVRGTGESTGLYFDEYTEQEQEDGCEIIGEHLVPVAMCPTCSVPIARSGVSCRLACIARVVEWPSRGLRQVLGRLQRPAARIQETNRIEGGDFVVFHRYDHSFGRMS